MSSAALVVHSPQSVDIAPRHVSLLRPIAAPADIIAAQEETRDLVAKALKPGRDYGKVPGTDKDTLLKPGAERVALAFGCYYGEPEIIEKECEHDRIVQWQKRATRKRTASEGQSIGLYRYVLRVPVIHRESGQIVGYGIGSCSSMESKYVESPRDVENTVFKMAHKRTIVGACLVTFALSDQFTQDVEDLEREEFDDTPGTSTAGPTPQPVRSDEPEARCPKCQGQMWDNRSTPGKPKTNPKAPDFKCRDKACDGVYWPGTWPPVVKPVASEELRNELARFAADPRVKTPTRQKLIRALEGGEIVQATAIMWIEQLQAKYSAEVADQHSGPPSGPSTTPTTPSAIDGSERSVATSGTKTDEPDLVKAAADQQRRAEAPKQRGTPMPANYGGEDQIPV